MNQRDFEDSGRNGKKGKYNSPLALYVNTAVQYAMVVLQVVEDSCRRLRSTTIGEYVQHSLLCQSPNTFI